MAFIERDGRLLMKHLRWAAIMMAAVAFFSVVFFSGRSSAADDPSSLSWRGVTIGMTRAEAVEHLRSLGFIPQPIQWGGRKRESWEGTLAAFPKGGECTGETGEQCEEAFLSIARDPEGREIVWVISAYSRLSTPIYVERLLAPAFDRFGDRYVVDWENGYKMPNGSVQFRLWNGHWFPNGSQDKGEIMVSASIFPRQVINPSDPVPPVPNRDARAWGVNFMVSDQRIHDRIEKEYDDRARNIPPPVRY